MHILRYKEQNMTSHKQSASSFIRRMMRDDERASLPAALWWLGDDQSKEPTIDQMIKSSSSSVINVVMGGQGRADRKNGPLNSDIQACKEIQLKQYACAALESWRGPFFQTWI